MQVLKFGGTSVANASNILKVIDIVRCAIVKDQAIVVVSAMGGATDMLIEAGKLAASHNPGYKQKLEDFGMRHQEVARELLSADRLTRVLCILDDRCHELDRISEAVFSLRELSPRTQDRIVSHGELLSSMIIAAAFESRLIDNIWLDAREIIRTDSGYGAAAPNPEITSELLRDCLKKKTRATIHHARIHCLKQQRCDNNPGTGWLGPHSFPGCRRNGCHSA